MTTVFKKWPGALPGAVLLLSLLPTPARAGPFDSCTLTLSTGGALKLNTAGSTLSSEAAGGSAAVLLVVAVGLKPNLTFSAPVLSNSPTGYNNTPQVALRYSSLAGGNQPYTAAATGYTATALLDTITLNARVIDTKGYKAGTYTVSTTATCQQ